ncbi:MAG: beta-propeller domain-containing protein, partial [Planctomycetia bacterium]
ASQPVSDAALAKRIRQAPIARMLPTWTTTVVQANGSSATSLPQLVSRPQDVLSPAIGDEVNLTSVVLIDVRAATAGITGATSVIGGYASTLHMNAEELYVFSPRWESIHGERTDVQRFDITAAAPRFVASGSFGGHLLNQFSADDHGDFLRVAVTQTTHEPATDDAAVSVGSSDMVVSLPFMPWTTNRSNALYVLATQGDTLAVVGSVENIAPGESIMSARFVGDTAYMVTFEQVDPLYVIDLSTPTAPRIAGELKVPGFSRFLQPLDDGFLLGIGRDADPDTGRTRGLKVSLFDVRDPSAPTEVSTFLIDQPTQGWSWSGAEWDYHALGFFPELDVIALPVQSVTWTDDPTTGLSTWQMLSGVVVLDIDPVGGITELGTVAHDSHLLRTARIGSTLYSVADLDLKAVDVVSGGVSPRGAVTLQQPYRWEVT